AGSNSVTVPGPGFPAPDAEVTVWDARPVEREECRGGFHARSVTFSAASCAAEPDGGWAVGPRVGGLAPRISPPGVPPAATLRGPPAGAQETVAGGLRAVPLSSAARNAP